jgi:hypothetical protein
MLELLKNFALLIGVPPYLTSFPQATSIVPGVVHAPCAPPSFAFVLYMPSQFVPISDAVRFSAIAPLRTDGAKANNSDRQINVSRFLGIIP